MIIKYMLRSTVTGFIPTYHEASMIIFTLQNIDVDNQYKNKDP